MLTDTLHSRPSMRTGLPSAARIRSAARRPGLLDVFSSRTANSSPPRRAAMSGSRNNDVSCAATSTSNRSPAWCPSVSFTDLNRSRSRNNTVTGVP